MGKKQRDPKKQQPPPPPKDLDARRKDINRLQQQLKESNLADDLYKITDIYQRMETFVESGEPCSGSIPLPAYKRSLDYIFTTTPHLHSSLKLRVVQYR